MNIFWQDFRYALRMLRKNAAMSAVIVLSLAIGIGANTAVFSVADALLLRPLPYPQPGALAALWLRSPGIGIPQDWPSPGQYIDIVTQNHVFSETSISRGTSRNLLGSAQPQRVEGILTSSSLFHLLGAQPLLGRLLLPAEDKPGAPNAAVLSYPLWTRLFNADPNIVGKSINLSGDSFTVVGVLRPDFLLNNEVMQTVASINNIEIFLPLPLGANAVTQRGNENFNLMARLKPGVTMQQAQADISVIASHIREIDHRDRSFTISVVPLIDQVVGNVRRALLVLLGSVALVLLIACANVANLLLSRATGRQKEVAIRAALGAGWKRLIRQLLTESVLLGLLGGAAGLIVAWWSLHLLRTINPGNIPRLDEIAINGPVLAFTFAVSILTGVVFGLAPALRAAKVDLNTTLKAGGRSSQRDGGFNLVRNRLRSLLVAAELALSLMLLIGAGLLVRSFVRLQSVPPGFNPSGVLSMRIAAGGPKYRDQKDPGAAARLYRQLGAGVAALPGVSAAGAVTALPFTSSVGWGGIGIEGYTPSPSEPELQVDQRSATTDYFRAMEVPLIKGRFFSSTDVPGAQSVAIIDEKMARRFWPGQSPIGKHVWQDPKAKAEIVGVVGTVKQYGLDIDGRMVVYYAHAQQAGGSMYYVVRTSADPATLAGPVIRQVHALDPDAPVFEVRTMEDRLRDSLARQRFSTTMLGAFSLFAMVLAAIGVYGAISYLVTQGTHDLGLRIALGASRTNIVRLVVGQGMALAGIGIAAGLLGALALTRVMATLLFGVSATDLATFAIVPAFLAAVALLASYVPARRATRVDPMVALREE